MSAELRAVYESQTGSKVWMKSDICKRYLKKNSDCLRCKHAPVCKDYIKTLAEWAGANK